MRNFQAQQGVPVPRYKLKGSLGVVWDLDETPADARLTLSYRGR